MSESKHKLDDLYAILSLTTFTRAQAKFSSVSFTVRTLLNPSLCLSHKWVPGLSAYSEECVTAPSEVKEKKKQKKHY